MFVVCCMGMMVGLCLSFYVFFCKPVDVVDGISLRACCSDGGSLLPLYNTHRSSYALHGVDYHAATKHTYIAISSSIY